jgi:transposase
VTDTVTDTVTETVTEAAKRLDITLHYLAPYSPNLNPSERRCKVMNKHAINSQFFTTTLPDIADSLGSTINDNFQQFKPAS